MTLSIIIPAYNEGSRIGPSLENAFAYFASKTYDVELLIVDDGSSDDTLEKVAAVCSAKLGEIPNVTCRAIPLGRNSGKGAAVRRGMLDAKGTVRVFTDADFSTPIREVEKVIPLIDSGQFQVVIGSRAAEGRRLVKKHQPWYREAMGRFFNLLVQLLVFRGIRDTQCGFKGFSAEAADNLFSKQKLTGFTFDVEVLYLAKKTGYRIKEIAIEWYNDERTTVGAVSDSTKMFLELMRIRKLHRFDA